MSLDRCIPELIEKGEITKDEGDYIASLYEKLARRHREQYGDATARALASSQALDVATAALRKKKQRAYLQIAAQRGALDDMGKYRGREGKWDFGRAAAALLVRDERGTAYPNVEYKERAIRQRALGRMADLIVHHGRNIVGEIRDKAGLIDLLRETYGEKSGNESAAVFARSWGDVIEELRLRANAAGANIGKIERWGVGQSHDGHAVRMAGADDPRLPPLEQARKTAKGEELARIERTIREIHFQAWRAAELPRLDRARMIDYETGQPFDNAGIDELLRKAFDNIVSEGWATRDEGAHRGGSIADQGSEHRVLIYKDAESWLASHAQFGGTATVYDAMMGHVHHMAKQIALMERLGPNPAATVRWLKDVVRKKAMTEGGAGSAADQASFKAAERIDRLYKSITGESRRPESRRLAAIGEALRTYQVATKLGSAALSTTSDVATGVLTRAFNDLPMAEIATGYAKYLNPANVEDRLQAQRMGFVAEQAGSKISGAARAMAEEMTGEFTRRLAEGTMRLSALNAITEAGRWTHGMGTLSHITRERGKAFDALDEGFRGMFERYGMGADAWDAIRATPIAEENGGQWIKPDRIANRPLADRLMEMIYQEMDVAVPTSGVEFRAQLDRIAPKGTWIGEGIRTAFQFKAFPVTLMMIQGQRAMARSGTNFDRLAAFGMFLGASTLAGAFALQMKELTKGRNARPMTKMRFFLEAVAQGGGAGIYGDFVRSTESRFNSGIWQVTAGPAVQTLNNAGTLVGGNILRAVQGERTHIQSDLHTLVKNETPIIGSLWYTRLAYERAALDMWRRAADPAAGHAFERMEGKYRREYGQSYWWHPGQLTPSDAPQLDEAFNTAPLPQPAQGRAGW